MITQKMVYTTRVGIRIGGLTEDQCKNAVLYLKNRELEADENAGFEKLLSVMKSEDVTSSDKINNKILIIYTYDGVFPSDNNSNVYGVHDPLSFSIPEMYIKFRNTYRKLMNVVNDVKNYIGIE